MTPRDVLEHIGDDFGNDSETKGQRAASTFRCATVRVAVAIEGCGPAELLLGLDNDSFGGLSLVRCTTDARLHGKG
jgi:hypothetical protein